MCTHLHLMGSDSESPYFPIGMYVSPLRLPFTRKLFRITRTSRDWIWHSAMTATPGLAVARAHPLKMVFLKQQGEGGPLGASGCLPILLSEPRIVRLGDTQKRPAGRFGFRSVRYLQAIQFMSSISMKKFTILSRMSNGIRTY